MKKELQPDYKKLIKRIELALPLVGFYDAPDPKPFEPLVKPKKGDCVFSFYKNLLR